MASLVRVVQALGLTDQLQSLFVLQVQSIAQMEQAPAGPTSARTAQGPGHARASREEVAGVL